MDVTTISNNVIFLCEKSLKFKIQDLHEFHNKRHEYIHLFIALLLKIIVVEAPTFFFNVFYHMDDSVQSFVLMGGERIRLYLYGLSINAFH